MGWREIEDQWSRMTQVVADLFPASTSSELAQVPSDADAIADRIARDNELTRAEVEEILLFRALPRMQSANDMQMAAE